jgi:hypothetical protein
MAECGIQQFRNAFVPQVLIGTEIFAFNVVEDKPIKPMLVVSVLMEHSIMEVNAPLSNPINAHQSLIQFGMETPVCVILDTLLSECNAFVKDWLLALPIVADVTTNPTPLGATEFANAMLALMMFKESADQHQPLILLIPQILPFLPILLLLQSAM